MKAKSDAPKKEENLDQNNLQSQVDDLNNKLVRSLADYQNLQRQTVNQIEMMRISSMSEILKGMSELVDDLSLATDSVEENKREGLLSISSKLEKLITEQGCKIIKPRENSEFDSSTMEAITQTNTEDKQKNNKVAQTVSIGLKYGERVLKPARVITYKL